MDNINQWLHCDDPPIDPGLFEDIGFEQWISTDQDPMGDCMGKAKGPKAASSYTAPVQSDSSMPPKVPTTAPSQPATEPTYPSFEDLCQGWEDFARSADLPSNQFPDLDQTHDNPQYPYPDLLGQDYTGTRHTSLHGGINPCLPNAKSPQIMYDYDQQCLNQGQTFVPQQTDFTFSTTADFAAPLFPEDGFDDPYSPAPRSRQARSKRHASPAENPTCIDCGKKYRTSSSAGRCTRCGAKYERRVAQPFRYTLDQSIPDFSLAKRAIFSPIAGRQVYQDDVHKYTRDALAENRFVQLLLDAINVVQSREEGWDTWSVRQQKTFNEKAKLEPGYTNALVTARLRALYREVLNYHVGGEAVYALGGDNSGYADDRTLRFSQRMATICAVLKKNKRVVMDVVEGRGVQGFVSNPKKYHERKASNNNCNVEKKRIMEKGKEIEAEVGRLVTAATDRRKRARTVDALSPEPE